MSADHASPPPPPEPKTPMWLTALGAVLFALAALFWLAMPSSDAAAAGADAGADAPAPNPSPSAAAP